MVHLRQTDTEGKNVFTKHMPPSTRKWQQFWQNACIIYFEQVSITIAWLLSNHFHNLVIGQAIKGKALEWNEMAQHLTWLMACQWYVDIPFLVKTLLYSWNSVDRYSLQTQVSSLYSILGWRVLLHLINSTTRGPCLFDVLHLEKREREYVTVTGHRTATEQGSTIPLLCRKHDFHSLLTKKKRKRNCVHHYIWELTGRSVICFDSPQWFT